MWSGIYSTCMGNTQRFGAETSKTIVGLHAIFIGIGEVLGGGSFGILGDKTNKWGRSPIILLGTFLHVACFFLIFLNIPSGSPMGPVDSVSYIKTPDPYIALLCSFLLGLGDACWNTQIYSILGSLYPDDSAPAFAIFKFWQSLFAAASFFYGSHLLLHYQLLILSVMVIAAAIAFLPVELISQGIVQKIMYLCLRNSYSFVINY